MGFKGHDTFIRNEKRRIAKRAGNDKIHHFRNLSSLDDHQVGKRPYLFFVQEDLCPEHFAQEEFPVGSLRLCVRGISVFIHRLPQVNNVQNL